MQVSSLLCVCMWHRKYEKWIGQRLSISEITGIWEREWTCMITKEQGNMK